MMINKMTDLLNKIERRLATKPLNLPDFLQKDNWVEVISNDSLTTFSRYFPRKTTISLDAQGPKTKDGYYLIDDAISDDVEIIGVKDINWGLFAHDSIRMQQTQGYGIYDFLSNGYGMDDTMLLQMRADHMSIFNNGIYVDFVHPNKIKLVSTTGAEILRNVVSIPIDIFIKHSDNLMTISPTKMETFEALAQADVARFLHSNLKYFDGLETVYANIDLKLSDLESEAGKRDDIINYIKESYVSAGNDDQPIIITV